MPMLQDIWVHEEHGWVVDGFGRCIVSVGDGVVPHLVGFRMGTAALVRLCIFAFESLSRRIRYCLTPVFEECVAAAAYLTQCEQCGSVLSHLLLRTLQLAHTFRARRAGSLLGGCICDYVSAAGVSWMERCVKEGGCTSGRSLVGHLRVLAVFKPQNCGFPAADRLHNYLALAILCSISPTTKQ